MVNHRKCPSTYTLEIISTSVENVKNCGHGGRRSQLKCELCYVLAYLEMLLKINGDDNK